MYVVLGDLLADYSAHIPDLCSHPRDLQRISYLELGPGGACNVAIMARRFGLPVACLGEVGGDIFGEIVLDGLRREGVDVSNIVVNEAAHTPVATVLVDERGEPAYLGYRGTLQMIALPDDWRPVIEQADGLFSDGWIEYQEVADIILEAFRVAQNAGVPVFFDPGPGNPDIDNEWHREAALLASVLLATEEEAKRLSGERDPVASARALLQGGTGTVIIKRGAAGAFLLSDGDFEIAPGLPVEALDTTGAGDSFAGAVLYGCRQNLNLEMLGILGNATGAAKVQKQGTGHNMPTMDEVQVMLERFDFSVPDLLPSSGDGESKG
ncbi:MAG TPA: carbohydrate kinase family protein [Candidatus Sulfomarinibacteraceae bacterium]|nr:carbohydrate kinase family protein [Candidatus Sulfomarinibacteraceae bacterium]